MGERRETLTRVIIIGVIAALALIGGIAFVKKNNDEVPENAVPGIDVEAEETTSVPNVTYDVNWSDDYNGLITEISEVTIVNDGTIRLAMKLENTSTDHKFTTYPNQMTLITPNGKQKEANIMVGNELSGTIYDGVTKKGWIEIITDDPDAVNYKELRLVWRADFKEYDVMLKLQ